MKVVNHQKSMNSEVATIEKYLLECNDPREAIINVVVGFDGNPAITVKLYKSLIGSCDVQIALFEIDVVAKAYSGRNGTQGFFTRNTEYGEIMTALSTRKIELSHSFTTEFVKKVLGIS